MKRFLVAVILAISLLGTVPAAALAAPAVPQNDCQHGTFVEVTTLYSGYRSTPNSNFIIYTRMQELDYDSNNVRHICYIQAMIKVHNNSAQGRYVHYLLVEVDNSAGQLVGGQPSWVGPGGTGDAYLAPNADWYMYGSWYGGFSCGVYYKSFAWMNEGYTGNETGGGWGPTVTIC